MSVRDRILTALRENEDTWVSGQALAESLNVSRTAIWKHIKNLSEEGYEIESHSKKGYRISGPADVLTPEEVRLNLNTEIFGQQHYLYYREIDSTNNRAKILAGEGYPEGTVVVADKQTAGRGRRGRTCAYRGAFARGGHPAIREEGECGGGACAGPMQPCERHRRRDGRGA